MGRKIRRDAPFTVKCDDENNTAADVATGRINVDVAIRVPISKKPKLSAAERTVPMPFLRERAPGVTYVEFEDTRKLVTLKLFDAVTSEMIEGAIVRIAPCGTDADVDLENFRGHLLDAGAERVIILPRSRANVLPDKKIAHVRARGIREVVQGLIAESAFDDKVTLAEFVEEILAAEGL